MSHSPDKSQTLPVHFRCDLCSKKARCEVPEREAEADIKEWLETHVIPKIVRSHSLVSPRCEPFATKDGQRVLTIAAAFPLPDDDHPFGTASEEAKEKSRAAGFPTQPGKPI